MFGHELAVEESEVSRPKACNEPGEGDLRRVAPPAEHAFSEEGSAELDSVEPADELFTFPHLDRMSMS